MICDSYIKTLNKVLCLSCILFSIYSCAQSKISKKLLGNTAKIIYMRPNGNDLNSGYTKDKALQSVKKYRSRLYGLYFKGNI